MVSLRFAFLTSFYPPYSFGGDGIAIQRLARALARRGHRVTVFHDIDAFNALATRRDAAPEPEAEGIEVVGLKSRLGPLSPLLTQQLGRPIANGREIARRLTEGQHDVITYHNVSLVGGPGLFRYGSAIKLYMAHEHWLICPTHVLWRHRREVCVGRECLRCQLRHRRPPQWWRWTGLLEREARHIDAFIAMSEFSRDKHREFGFPFPMEVVPPFVEEHEHDPGADQGSPHPRPYFLFAGRLEAIKGLDDVIPLFRLYRDADLVIAGDGPHTASLQRRAAGMDRVRFLGRVAEAQLRRYYRHAVALIVPSVCFETFGIVITEALQEGTPVISRRIGPFPELVARGGGLLFDTGDDLLAAMRRLHTDTAFRDALGRAGRAAFAANWSEGVVVSRYLDLVSRIAERTGRTLVRSVGVAR